MIKGSGASRAAVAASCAAFAFVAPALLTSECMMLHSKGWGDEAHPDTCVASLYTNYVLGIVPLEPGFKTFSFNPLACELVDSAEGEVPTPYGLICAAWWHEDEGGRVAWNVKAPEGTVCVEVRQRLSDHASGLEDAVRVF